MPQARQRRGVTVIELYADEKRTLAKAAAIMQFVANVCPRESAKTNAQTALGAIDDVLTDLAPEESEPQKGAA